MMTKLALAINQKRCIGCQACAEACKMENNVAMGMLWTRTLTEGSDVMDAAVGQFPNLRMDYLPLGCQHCENPACQKVCPTGATYKDEMGHVEIDYDKCIGCRMCMAACPYNVRVFNWNEPVHDPEQGYGDAAVPKRGKGVMEKCTLCKQRTDNGQKPMCVVCCPTHARVFGDLDDPNSEISRIKRERNVRILLEEMGTQPQVFYFA